MFNLFFKGLRLKETTSQSVCPLFTINCRSVLLSFMSCYEPFRCAAWFYFNVTECQKNNYLVIILCQSLRFSVSIKTDVPFLSSFNILVVEEMLSNIDGRVSFRYAFIIIYELKLIPVPFVMRY